MTISTTSNTTIAQGNGLTTSFDFGFAVPLASELFVYYTDTNNITTLVSPTSYSTTGIGTATGGSVTYPLAGSPIATGTSLTIQRIVPYTQLTDLVNQSGYYPNVVENALDYLTMQTQQLAEAAARTVQVPLSATIPDLSLPATVAGRANTVIGFDSNGNIIVLPLPASVGAGTMTAEGPFVAGVNFTGGTTTTLTLSQAYGSAANVDVHFDGTYQGPDQYSIVGNQIIFMSPIPGGVSKVYVVGGTTLSVNPLNGINVLSFTVDPTGVSDSTAGFQAAVNLGRRVIVPAGTYKMGQITIPANTAVIGEGNSTIIEPITGFAMNAFWLTNGSNIEIANLQMNLPVTIFPSTVPLYLQAGAFVHIHDVYMPAGGQIGIFGSNLTDSVVERCQVMASNVYGIQLTGVSQARNDIRYCETGPTLVSHGVQGQGGVDIKIIGHRSTGAKGFGVSIYQVIGALMSACTSVNSVLEAFEVTDSSHWIVRDCQGTWDNGISTDFGISVSAQGAACQDGLIQGNFLRNNGKAAIALASSGYALNNVIVDSNVIENTNALNLPLVNAGQAAILLYGSLCQNNLVQNNSIADGLGSTQYVVAEANVNGIGGMPSLNRFINNYGNGGAFAIPRTVKSLTSVEALCQGGSFVGWTPTIAASSGALTSVTLGSAQYYETEKKIDFELVFTITTNGTGAGSLTFTYPAGFTAVGGNGYGRESTISGKALSVSVGSALGSIFNYDNSYPGANGAQITVSGTFARA